MKPDYVVPDANVIIALCAEEADKYVTAAAQMQQYIIDGCQLFAPGVLAAEVLYILCNKLMRGTLTPTAHTAAVQTLHGYMQTIAPPPSGDAGLVLRAEQLRGTYGCSRSADGLYIATAEALVRRGVVEFVTFDIALSQQAIALVPTIQVQLLQVT